tara:strand:+ start:226 stop:1812 length:1587 start_codon:yes stop_codon:yes gene_type:complete
MSKSISLTVKKKNYSELLKMFGAILFYPSCLQGGPLSNIHSQIKRNSNIKEGDLNHIIETWWQGGLSYLTLNQLHVSGLSIRLYKNRFRKSGKNIKALNDEDHGSVYYRSRDGKNSKMIANKLGTFSPDSFTDMLATVKKIKASNELGIKIFESHATGGTDGDASVVEDSLITLNTFLQGEFLDKKLEENPKTAGKKIKVVTRNFSKLLNLCIKDINAEVLKQWLKTKERKLSQRQINAGETRWVLKPSTLKEAICTIRSCVQLAKEQGVITDHDLYTLPKFKMDNEIIRYLSQEEELRLYRTINQRNEHKLKLRKSTILHRRERNLIAPPQLNECAFSDHVTPFIILFKETGIRPGTLMNSKWTDVDFESRFFRIRKSIDKRSLANFIPLNDLAYTTLTEWRKHFIHKKCSRLIENKADAWLFPSPQSPSQQLTTIKTAWRSIIKNAQIHNFRFYDLRHDFASRVMMRTGNIYLVSHLLNHRQIETTKRYAHLMDNSKLLAVQTLDTDRQTGALPEFMRKRGIISKD